MHHIIETSTYCWVFICNFAIYFSPLIILGKINHDGKQQTVEAVVVDMDEGTAGSAIERMCATKVTGRWPIISEQS